MTQPQCRPAPSSRPSHPPPPPLSLCVRGWGPGPAVGRRPGGGARGCGPGQRLQQTVFGWAPQLLPPRPPSPPKALGVRGRETRAVPDSPALAQVSGTGRAGQGLGGQQFSQHLWTAAWSESGGVASSRLLAAASTHLLLVCHLYLQHGDLNTGYPRSVRRPGKGHDSQVIRASNAGTGPVNGGQTGGDAHLLVCGRTIYLQALALALLAAWGCMRPQSA